MAYKTTIMRATASKPFQTKYLFFIDMSINFHTAMITDNKVVKNKN